MATVGNNGIVLVGREIDWDPKEGPGVTEIYEGEEAALTTQAVQWFKAGYRARVDPHQGPIYRMRVFFPDGRDNRQVFTETWERTTEWAQLDIRNNPKVIKAAGGSSVTLALWVKDIKKALADGQQLSGTVDPGQEKLYTLYARGAEVYEVKRFVLRRRRVFPPKLASTVKLDVVEKIYTTAKLIVGWAVPALIVQQLPVDPAAADTPSDTAWGWRPRVDNSVTTLGRNANKTEEVLDFVFAAWSTLLYDIVA
jgi:hypothetical protein